MDSNLAIIAGRVDLLLRAVQAAEGVAARRFALDALSRGLLLADPGSITPAQREASAALRVDVSALASADAPTRPHAVPTPLVAGREHAAFVRQLHVTFDPLGPGSSPGLDGGAQRAIGVALDAAADRVKPPNAIDHYGFGPAMPQALQGTRLEGSSLGAAAFVSAMALWGGRPIRSGVAITGAIAGENILEVGQIAAKVQACVAHCMSALVVPEANGPEAQRLAAGRVAIWPVSSLEELSDRVLGVPRQIAPDKAVANAKAHFALGWRGYLWPTIHEELSRLVGGLPQGRIDLRVEVLARLAAAQRHLGDPVGALSVLREAEQAVMTDEGRQAVPDLILGLLFQQKAMTCRQLGLWGQASEAARRSVQIAQSARLRGELIKALGCLGLVAAARGQDAAAIAAFERSLDLVLRHNPTATARTRAYLIGAEGILGHRARARSHYEAAMAELRAQPDAAARRAAESWVLTRWGDALLRLNAPEEAARVLDHPAIDESLTDDPLPGLLARRALGLALCRTSGSESARHRGLEILAASTVAHGRGLEPHLRFLAHLNVLFEARERLAHGSWDRDIHGRASGALNELPDYGRFSTILAKPLRETRALFERAPRVRSLRALDTLLRRCERLA